MYYLFFFFHTFINAEATPTLSIPNGDLIFLYPNLSTSSPLDNAILSTGNATLNWMRQHNIEISSDVISLHVAVSYIKSPNERFFIQAVPPSVVMTPEKEFLLQIAPSTQLGLGLVLVIRICFKFGFLLNINFKPNLLALFLSVEAVKLAISSFKAFLALTVAASSFDALPFNTTSGVVILSRRATRSTV